MASKDVFSPEYLAAVAALEAADAADEANIAALQAFTPAVPGDWSPAPTTLQGAIDQLAARVKALEP
jgi:hypothetical protein